MLQQVFYLKVQVVEHQCLFELTGSGGIELNARLDYPATLRDAYDAWIKAYHNYYHSGMMGTAFCHGLEALPPNDLRFELVKAEEEFLYTFWNWLGNQELSQIRSQVVRAVRSLNVSERANETDKTVDIFISCNNSELEHFPWEAWDIVGEFGLTNKVRIARKAFNVQNESVKSQVRRQRILVIIGDETNLNFKRELDAIEKRLKPIANVRYWSHTDLPKPTSERLIGYLREAIAEKPGWDALFFFGHSDGADHLGGTLKIAPQTEIGLNELIPSLEVAKQNGLRFALFNSCNGLDHASILINLGIGQVVIMREPIQNQAAGKFFVRLLEILETHVDIHTAILKVVNEFKLNHNFEYPSVRLVTSLFLHPETELFRLYPVRWRETLKHWLPNARESIILPLFIVLSLIYPIQDRLLDWRYLGQAFYRELTQQFPQEVSSDLTLIHIDDASLEKANLSNRSRPMDRGYLAKIVNKLIEYKVNVIGLDYVLQCSGQI